LADSSELIIQGLWNDDIDSSKYGSNAKYADHLLEQYKLYVEMTDRNSSRRNIANTFFLTLHAAIFAAIGFVYEKGSQLLQHKEILTIAFIAMLVLCLAWWMLVRSYRLLNSAKFKVIGEYEKRLPSSPYWRAEWNALGKGRDWKRYMPLSLVESWVPAVFASLYLLLYILWMRQS
jgi:hypothetical protein